MQGPGRRRVPACTRDHVGEGEGVQVSAHVLTHVGPDRQQDALTLVLAGPVLVGPAEVAGHDGPVDGTHDLAEGDLLGGRAST